MLRAFCMTTTHFIVKVIILISTHSMLTNAPEYLSLEYNLVLTRVDFGRLVAGTPAAALWSSGAVSRVGYFLNNVSNLLRIVLLIRFGGIYFDSDVVSLKPLPEAEQVSCHLIATGIRFTQP